MSHALPGALLGFTLLGCATAAVATDALPPVQTSGEVRFVTGGVGQSEAQVFMRQRSHYPLVVEVYVREGGHEAYTADARVIVKNQRGETVLDEHTEGPFLLADVPPGRYTVQVERMELMQRRTVDIGGQGSTRRVFVFGAT